MKRIALGREGLFSALGLHVAAVGILAIAVLVLGVRVGLDWSTTSSSNVDAMESRQSELKLLQLQTAPLRGLDKKVELSRAQIDEFYGKRVPASWSVILEGLGNLQAKTKIHLSRVQYTRAPGSGDLTEIRMDAGVSGEYPQIMRFINGLERSQTFFVIRAMALTGQQSGTVNLRLQVSTWLRPADAAALPLEDAQPGSQSGSQPGSEPGSQTSSQPGSGSGSESGSGPGSQSSVQPAGTNSETTPNAGRAGPVTQPSTTDGRGL